MASTVTIDLRHVARGLDIPLRQIQATVELLDEGNTVPFITRYRKDQTGGLDEEQVRDIEGRLAKMRLLADRKQTILRSIESQGKLTEKLAKQILAATTAKRLEDLYLPYKPKKQTLATLARERGLEPLALEIFEGATSCLDLDARAADFVNSDRQVPTVADALLGAGHILAEHISERAELRERLRDVLQRTGALVTSRLVPEEKPQPDTTAKKVRNVATDAQPSQTKGFVETQSFTAVHEPVDVEILQALTLTSLQPATAELPLPLHSASSPPSSEEHLQSSTVESLPPHGSEESALPMPELLQPLSVASVQPASAEPLQSLTTHAVAPTDAASSSSEGSSLKPAAQRKLARQQAKQAAIKKREDKKKRIEEKKIKAFRDYFEYREDIRKIPPHRVLAINRGERARVLRVRVESDLQAMVNVVDEMLVPPAHPHADYLRGCARDALNRLMLPSLEREIRRELADHAEAHAVGVFAKNLRNLLLQPPVHGHRLLAIDPGFRSGCKLAALDEFGNLLDHAVIFLVGKPDRRDEAKTKVLELIERLQLTVIVVGNGTACRHTEDFVAEMVEKELKERGVAYVIVNEAGASVYSTSRIGREEFPEYDATLRGAISIGRRLQDPLSELVKIDPANIGVGLYQHDVKAKHLQTSLDGVVESCVNYVGVDVNTASPALLRYVSGLNQLTAKRVYEHRREHGPFRTREQLREVPSFGEATFVQAAGFLKIAGGDNPLDSTWIHPESYAAASRAMERLAAAGDSSDNEPATALAERIAAVDVEALAKELEVGVLTLKDILAQLARPGRDPREDLPAPVFKRGVIRIEDLATGMELTGTVLNVVDFGCFVDIGMHDSGLVHVSRLADKFVRDPHDVVAVGDIVKVWVMEVDKERRRVSLTMVRPGSERPKQPYQGGRPPRGKPADEGTPSEGGQRDQQQPPPRPAGQQRPPRRSDEQRPPRPAGEQRPPRPTGQQRPPRPAGERRPPHSQGGPPQGRGRSQHDQRRPLPQPRQAPKPVIPITDAMKVGKEPMRTFGDLMQFYQHKIPAPAEPKTPVPADGQPPAVVEESLPPAQPAATVEQPATLVEQPAATAEGPSPVSEPVSAANEEAPTVRNESPAVAQQAPVTPDEASA